MSALEITVGLAREFVRQVRDGNTQPFDPTTNPSPFTGSETLLCKVWEGDDLPPLVTPTTAWIDASIGLLRITFSNANAALLREGTYPYLVTATSGGLTYPIDRGQVRVSSAPGTGTRPLAFTTLNDLTKYLPMVGTIQADTSQYGFQEEQARATTFLVDGLCSLSKRAGLTPSIGEPGFNASSLGLLRSQAPDFWLRTQITPLLPNSSPPAWMGTYRQSVAANLIDPRVSTALLLYDSVKEICAKWALAYILRAQVTRVSDQDWWALAREFEGEANNRFRSTRFEVDLAVPQSGWGSVVIDGGSTNLR